MTKELHKTTVHV